VFVEVRKKKKADQNFKLHAASRTEAKKYIGKKSPLYSKICSRISLLYTNCNQYKNQTTEEKHLNIRKNGKRPVQGDWQKRTGLISHHIQAAHPGYK